MENIRENIISPTAEKILRYLDDSDRAHTARQIGSALDERPLVIGSLLGKLRRVGFVYFAPQDGGPDIWYATSEGHEAIFQIDLNAELRRKGLIR